MTVSEFRAGLKTLNRAFPRTVQLNDEQTVLWFEMLQDLDAEAWGRAVAFAIREGDDWPTIAKLRKYATGGGLGPEARGERCWLVVSQAISRVGGYASVCFSDPVVNATIRAAFGGWQQLCDLAGRDLDFRQRNFVKTYAALVQSRSLSVEQCAPLHGITNQQRSKDGFGVDETVAIDCGLPAPRLKITGEAPPELPRLTDESARPEVRRAASLLELPDVLRERKERRDEAKRQRAAIERQGFEAYKQAAIAQLMEAKQTAVPEP